MAFISSSFSNRKLQDRRFTTNQVGDSQEAFASVLSIGSNEVFTDTRYILTSSLPFSGSFQDGLIVSASRVDATITPGSADDLAISKYWFQKKLTPGATAVNSRNETFFFLTGALDSVSEQTIHGSQVTNFLSPKFGEASIGLAHTENATPGYNVRVYITNTDSQPGDGGSGAVEAAKYVFDYKTGVLSFVNNSDAPTTSQYVWISAYQYVGRTLQSQINDGSLGGSGFPFEGNAIITGSLIVSGATGNVDFTNATNGVSGSFSGSFTGDGSELTGLTVDASTINLGGVLGGTADNATFADNVLSGSVEGDAQGQIKLNGTNVNINNLGTDDSPTFTNLTLSGDLTVQGTTTTVNSTEVNIGDRILTLNAALGGGSGNAGIQVIVSASDGDPAAHTGSFVWDDDEKYWMGGESGSEARFLTTTDSSSIASDIAANIISITALNTETGSINTSITALNTKTGSLDTDITNINTSVTALNTKTGSLDTDITNINTSITALNTKTGSLDTDITNINTSITALNTETGSINTSITALNTKTGSLDTDITNINTSITALNTETGSINTSITALNTETGSINTSITALNTKTGSLDTDITNINTSITALNTETGSINTSITALNTKTGSLDTDITNINTSVTALNTKTGSLDTDITNINTSVTALNTKTGSLDTDITNINTSVTALNTFTGSAATYTNYTDNTVAVFTSTTGQIEGDSNFTWDGTTLTLGNSKNLTVGGDLTVSGTTTTVNSTTVEIGDNIIVLNSANVAADAGIHVIDNGSPGVTGSLVYNYDSNYWMAGEKDSEKRIALFNAGNPTNSGFIHLNDSDEIVSIASGSTVGAFLQKTADGFEVSATIDGGTY